MSSKWTLKYSLAAVLLAIVIIGVALVANQMPSLTPGQTSTAASFLVMLTDPPTLPPDANTTTLNLTYTDVSLHVVYPNATADWIPVNASGTVNLLSLINFSQTIASTTVPNGSSVDKIQFTISNVTAEVNGILYPVTALSSTLVISIANSDVNQTLSGVLVDFNPTLVQIQATDSNETLVNYYVLVPSATAAIVTSLSRDEIRVGTIVKLEQNNRVKLDRVEEEFSNNLTIVNATLSVNGNVTSLSVTLMNEGNATFKVLGLTLHGEFTATRTWPTEDHHMGEMMDDIRPEKIHPDTIPFKVNGSSLVPLFGDQNDRDHEGIQASWLTLQPGQNVTLSFNGMIDLQPDMGFMKGPAMVMTPIVGGNYTLRLMGEGFEKIDITATP